MDWSGNPLTPSGSGSDPLQVEIEAVLYRRNDGTTRIVAFRLALEGVFGAAAAEQQRKVHQRFVDLMVEGLSYRAAVSLVQSQEWAEVRKRLGPLTMFALSAGACVAAWLALT